MAKFNPTITAYLVPYIKEGYKKCKILLLDESTVVLLKIDHTSYTISTCSFAWYMGKGVYIRQSMNAHGIIYFKK